MEGSSNMQPQLGNVHMAGGGQPQPAASGPGIGQKEDGKANGEDRCEYGMTIGSKRQDSGDDSSSINVDFEDLWSLRKYLLLLGILVVGVTYNAGLNPPGGFWTNNKDDHRAGDPLLPEYSFQRYEVFFYCNAMAFAASLTLIILLLSKEVSSRHVWLRSMQGTMTLDLFSLMGAYAAGSCRALKSSIYILVLVMAVFFYVGIHILLLSIRVIPRRWKEKVQATLNKVLSICHVHGKCRSSHQEKEEIKEEIEEARKFILMLVTFAATITYQAGLSPPGGFWTENKDNHHQATSILRTHYLRRYNIFISCNSTSFVASLVTVILLRSKEWSGHGIKSKALVVCVIADLLGLIGAYAAGSCREVATSFYVMFIILVVFICIMLVVAMFVYQPISEWLGKIKPYMLEWTEKLGRLLSFTEPENSPADPQQAAGVVNTGAPAEMSSSEQEHQSVDNKQAAISKKRSSHEEHQPAGGHNIANTEEAVSNAENPTVDGQQAANINDVTPKLEHPSEGDQLVANTKVVMSDKEHLHVDVLSKQTISSSGHGGTMDDLTVDNRASYVRPVTADGQVGRAEQHTYAVGDERSTADSNCHAPEIQKDDSNNNAQAFKDGHANNYQVALHQNSTKKAAGNPTDVHLKKSRTYLLLLAILAVSLTYQSGLNPPGGFWSTKEKGHSAGDPILEDTNHNRYVAFFYFNAVAFVASTVMIVMLLNKKMSNKVTKRRALQIAMIVDLLALMGSFVSGSCRDTKKSIYISVLICLVIAYVTVHVLISIHVIPKRWKEQVAKELKGLSCELIWPEPTNQTVDIKEKGLERRRNLLLMLAVLAATVTYQAGINPPGGVWSDDKELPTTPSNPVLQGSHQISITPGNPVLQDSHRTHFDVFYYSNSLSFVSSVVITILLVNKESCEQGIKSYALRVCLLVGLVSLLIAYVAGSCRKAKEVIYLIIIAVAVLISLVIQVFLLSSTQDALGQPLNQIKKWLQKLFCAAGDRPGTASEGLPGPGLADNDCRRKKERKRYKYLMLLAVLAASITYQAGLNPPGGFWSDDDSNGHKAGNPILRDIHHRRYKAFFICNAISFMASLVVIMLLLSKSVRKRKVPLQALHFIMIVDLLALMTAYAAGSCRKVRTSVVVFVLVFAVLIYLVIAIVLSSGIAKWLKKRDERWLSCWRHPQHVSETNALTRRPPV